MAAGWRPTIRHTVQMVDPIGAGDAYVAGYLWPRSWADAAGSCERRSDSCRAEVLDLGDVALVSHATSRTPCRGQTSPLSVSGCNFSVLNALGTQY